MSSLEHGGTEMRFLDLFRNAHGREYHFDVLIHHPLGNDFEQEIKENGGQILYCGKLRNIVSFAMRFNQLIKKGGYDVVHCHIPEFSAVCLAIARGRQVGKRIAHFHHIKPEKPSNSRRLIQHVLVQFILASASNIIGISKHVLNTWFGPAWQNNSKLQVVYDGIDFSDFAQKYDKTQFSNELGISVNKPIALHVGSFRPVKNHGLILSIAEKLKDIQFILEIGRAHV